MKIKFIVSLIVTALFTQCAVAQTLEEQVPVTDLQKSDVLPTAAPEISKHCAPAHLSDSTKKPDLVSFVILLKPEQNLIPQQAQYAQQNKSAISGTICGGEDEDWISWDAWRHRIADAVWIPVRAERVVIYGQTSVEYDVTCDHHIHITNISTPDPTGYSGQILAQAIKCLDGDPVLAFPEGSKQTIHHNWNKAFGPPIPATSGRTIYLPGGMEHVTRQW